MINDRYYARLIRICALMGALTMPLAACGKKDEPVEEPAVTEPVVIDEEDTIAPGISVGGADIGGQNMQQARQSIQSVADVRRSTMIVTLSAQENSWTLSSDDLGLTADVQQTLSNAIASSQGGARDVPIVWKIDSDRLAAKLDEIALEVNTDVVEPAARYTPDGPDRFAYDEGTPGRSVDTVALSANIQGAIQRGEPSPTIPIPTEEVLPQKTLADVKANLVRIVVVNTSYAGNGSSARVANLVLGCEKINGTLVKPGREFSFNDETGPRDREPWQKAATIVGGNTFEDDYGGGICQVSTTLYNAVLKADLKISKRNKHSIPSSYVPYGLDATVAYGSKDFKFVNNTDYPVYIFANVDKNDQKVYVSIYGRPLPDNQSITLRSVTVKETDPQSAEVVQDYTASPGSTKVVIKERKGYTVKVTKEYVVGGKVVDTVDLYTDTYAPVRGVVSVGARAEGPVENDPEIDQMIPEETTETPDAAVDTPVQTEKPAKTEKPSTPEPTEEKPANNDDQGDSVEVFDIEPDDDGAIDIPEEGEE